MGLRLGIDLDGVVADFNRGWTSAYNAGFGTDLAPEMVTTWDSPLELTHFPDMPAFWDWAKDHGGHSVFRHLEAYPSAVETLHALEAEGHHIVIVTAKPDWAVHDTLRWIADHRIPTREIHATEAKHEVRCDVYLDDAPDQVQRITEHRAHEATVCRFVRAWNHPVPGARDVHDWDEFHAVVRELAGAPVR
jgi:5'(3')-deoxyribonucleotidase